MSEEGSDPFFLLGLEPRLWLEPETIRERVLQRSATLHPDGPDGDAEAFASLREAGRQLADPAQRILLILQIHGEAPLKTPPGPMALGFFDAIARHQQSTVPVLREAAPTSAIAAAVYAGKRKTAAEASGLLLKKIDEALEVLEARLRFYDTEKMPPMDELRVLAGEYRTLQKWRGELAEHCFLLTQNSRSSLS